MFVANNEAGMSVNVADKRWTKESLRNIRNDTRFFCPACQQELELRVGTVISAHFAHKKLTNCQIKGEPESHYHLKGKQDLYEWLTRQSDVTNVELEPYLKEIKQRPDLLYTSEKQRIAIEYQCSTIDARMLTKRTLNYQKLNINVRWILGGNKVNRKGAYSFHLSPFQWRFIEVKNNFSPPSLYAYCPNNKSFIILHCIIPFSAKVIFSIHQSLPIQTTNLKQLYKPVSSIKAIYSSWFNHVRRFRLTSTSYASMEVRNLQETLYKKKGIPLSYLPSIAFIPLKTAYLIESPCYVWQGWILLFIESKPVNDTFSFRDVCQFVEKNTSRFRITPRHLPQIKAHYSYVVKEYLNKLCALCLLTNTSQNQFRKTEDIPWITKIEAIVKSDEDLLKKLNHTP